MFKPARTYWIAAGILAVLAIFPLAAPTAFRIDEAKTPLFENFPVRVGDWTGQDEALDERTYEILETRNVLSRGYQNSSGEKVNLLIVGSQQDRRVAHPPQVCYLSSNYTLLNEASDTLRVNELSVPVKGFTAKHEKMTVAQEQVLYLYKVGKRYTTNYYAQQLQFALDRLMRQDTQILLIRVAGSDKNVSSGFLKEVIHELEKGDDAK